MESGSPHLSAVMVDDGHIIGGATLCVYDSLTGRKVSVEVLMVGAAYRGQHLGKQLMEHLVNYAKRDLSPIDLYLTSHPSRKATNALYQSLGFDRLEKNVYAIKLRV